MTAPSDATTDLRPTPFAARFPETAGEAIDVYGFAVPLFLVDVDEEYDAIRHRVAVLEFSMLFKWDVRGADAVAVADAVFSRNLRDLAARRIAYGVVVDESGHMLDDVTGTVLADDHVRIIGGNPATVDALRRHAEGRDAEVTEIRDTLGVLSVQGPRSRELLQRLTDRDMSNEAFPYYSYDPAMTVAGIPAHVNRMGFTAELGYEVMVPVERALELWDALFEAGQDLGVQAASAGALMVARVEAGMVMGEVEYDATSTPFECRMGWAVDFDKGDFQGREALLSLKDGVSARVVSVVVDADPDAADGARLVDAGEDVGWVTMAVPSPVLDGKTLGLARVAVGSAKIGTTLALADGAVATVVRTPVYDPDRDRVRS
ncbi:aminomethyltransferase family protein [Aeromicrobium fastidiosum]|uniref:Aminomethyl transferase family protein n=1 Tax=Aeromicrobium fastidiosum TaxID=52699 RepID=A0A641AR45_9ACTN|nr:aminomethyltransferase family protein [Aeromicrobium fastidiosum]KAA1380584.1 aminomethyl transferase family protein [Aeromicrobium fastidiosum]MBP2390182.1 aminomethyltransferase [Aeromicrobium fastidiosum]